MPSKPTQDEVVRLFDGAYDSSRMPTHAGAEFLAEAHSRAVTLWLIRLAVVVGLAAAVGLAVVGYKLATTPPALPDALPAQDDPGAGPNRGAMGHDRATDGILEPLGIERGLLVGVRGQ